MQHTYMLQMQNKRVFYVCVRTYTREGIRGLCRCYIMDATHKDNAYKKQLWMNTKAQ